MVAIVLGLYLLFKGRRRPEHIIGISFGYTVFIITLAYCWNMTNLGNNSYFPAILLGAGVGYYAFQHLGHLFVATLGAIVGLLLALIIISIFAITNDIVVYALILGGILVGFTGHFMDAEVELWMTCVVGAYLIVEGLTTFLGGLPSFMTGIQNLINGSGSYKEATLFYFIIFIALILYGRHYQIKN